ncbi:MAG: Hint domain-containing protein [Rhodobacteraceae bacterium]|nr:Hint domain-containing protein [Paracoccaceae bacterium]
MSNYSIWVLGESQVTVSGGVTLDGVTQGDGGQLDGQTLTLNSSLDTEINIEDFGTETNFSDNDGSQRLDGTQVIDGISYADGTIVEAEYQFVVQDDSTGLQYTLVAFNVHNSSPSYGTTEGLCFLGEAPPVGVPLTVISTSEGPSNSGSNATDANDYVPLCFCQNTQIETIFGPVAVENLKAGDQVIGLDNSRLTLKKVFRSEFTARQMAANPKLRPVRISAQTLGNGLPKRDLLVSRQHRMLTSSKIAQRMFGVLNVLIPAIKLTDLPGIYVDEDVQQVTYFHLLFDKHEVVFAEGAPSESLFTGPEALKSVSSEARAEILLLMPALKAADYAPEPVMFIPDRSKQKQLVARHARNDKPLLM